MLLRRPLRLIHLRSVQIETVAERWMLGEISGVLLQATSGTGKKRM
jgi:hypothetical protein